MELSALLHRRSANLRDGVNPFRAQDSFEPCRLWFRRRRKVGRSRLLWDGDGPRNSARARCGVRKPRDIPSFAPNCSPGSQFSREYRRLFGAPPGQDGERLRRWKELRDAAY
jgi:hypothetical protein